MHSALISSSQKHLSPTKKSAFSSYPEFYCCYLLQSLKKKGSTYIGSTPDPVRRLRQHNGALKNGGAYRTRAEGSRPWEMVCIVYGFPSQIAALQFEHAWQHGHQTRYVQHKTQKQNNSQGAGHGRARSLARKVGIMRLLLQHNYFKFMRLTVHFFNTDVHQVWLTNKYKVASITAPVVTISTEENSIMNVELLHTEPTKETENCDTSDAENQSQRNLLLVKGLLAFCLDTYRSKFKRYTEKLLQGPYSCQICQEIFDYTTIEKTEQPLIGFCLSTSCAFAYHLQCLHRYFMDDEELKDGKRNLIPMSGQCPECSINMPWPDVVKYSVNIKQTFGILIDE